MQVVELVGEVPNCKSCRGDEHCSSEEDKIWLRRSESACACTVNRRPVDVSWVIGRFGRFTVGRRRGPYIGLLLMSEIDLPSSVTHLIPSTTTTDSAHNPSSCSLPAYAPRLTASVMSATSTPSQSGPPGADPSSSGQATPAKRKFNWKNGPPSCKECVRLKLKVSLAAIAPWKKLTSSVLAILAVLELRSSRMREDLSRRNIGWKVRYEVPDALPHFLHSLTHRPSKDQATIARLQKEIDELKSRLELVAKHSPVEPLGISHPSVDTQASVSGEGYFEITYSH